MPYVKTQVVGVLANRVAHNFVMVFGEYIKKTEKNKTVQKILYFYILALVYAIYKRVPKKI